MKIPFNRIFLSLGLLLSLCASGLRAQVYNFTTIAGRPGLDERDGTNTYALFANPSPAAMDAWSNIYVCDINTVRRISPVGTNWVVTTLAGGTSGYADGTNGQARFNSPQGIAVDSATNIYVSDTYNNVIRKITPVGTNWVVSTWAGSRLISGTSDGIGGAAQFNSPGGMAMDRVGNLYVADTDNDAIRKVVSLGSVGNVSTIAGTAGSGFIQPSAGSVDGSGTVARFHFPSGIAVDAKTNIYVTDSGNETLRKLVFTNHTWMVTTLAGSVTNIGSADGTNTAATFNDPLGITVDGATNLYVTDTRNHIVRHVFPSGTNWVVNTIAGLASQAGTVDGTNDTARFQFPQGIVVDGSGNLTVADTANEIIRRIVPQGTNFIVTTIAGNPTVRQVDGPGSGATFWWPTAVAPDGFGVLYVADRANHAIRKVVRDGSGWTVSTIAGLPGFSGSADGTNSDARFDLPTDIALDTRGNLYVADEFNHTIRKIVPDGTNWVVQTIAGLAGTFGGMDGTNAGARFYSPQRIAMDSGGNIFVSDLNKIRMITPSGTNWVVTTPISGPQAGAGGIAVDSADNVYVSDVTGLIEEFSPSGTNWVVTTIAGQAYSAGSVDGTNTDARFRSPAGVALGASGNLYVADGANDTIRMITPVGTNWVVTTVGGVATNAGSLDGVGSRARFNSPQGIAVDSHGNLYIADFLNDTIRIGELLPTLGIAFSNNQPILSWPVSLSSYVLESTSDLSVAGSWIPVSGLAVTNNNTVSVIDTAGGSLVFYRLRLQ
jgi:hypothetical protein